MSESSIDAMSNFLTLALDNYAKNFTSSDRDYAVALALYDVATKHHITLGIDEGSLLAKLWEYVAFSPPKKTTGSNTSVCSKEPKDPTQFIAWARLCHCLLYTSPSPRD